MEPIDEHFVRAVEAMAVRERADAGPPRSQLEALFVAQAESRHLDFAARYLQQQGVGFYTIGSAGHESNAAVGMLSRTTDPALLHYRSGGFFGARAHLDGTVDPVRETLRSLTGSSSDPISGGRHKVFGHPKLHVIPQTSTIASHLPRAVGLGFALGLAGQLDRETPWPDDAVVLCSFGDASVNHSTATGALNAAAYLTYVHRDCPVLFVCEDNGIGISTRTPKGWVAAALRSRGFPYLHAHGHDPAELLATTEEALAVVRNSRGPAVLHLSTVRFMGHAGSDVEIAYRSPAAIQADRARDPLVGTAQLLVESGHWTPVQVLERYEQIRQTVRKVATEVSAEPRLETREEVMDPLVVRTPPARPPAPTREPGVAMTLAQAINATLADELEDHGDVLVFGEDVAAKGGVYGVTRGLQGRFGAARVFDTLLDEQTVLGTALGAGLAGFLPVPEIQYLAYLHNAEDQLRGEAASLRFFSAGQYANGMVVRVPGLAYQKGFGGHFHNDNSLTVLRDLPGVVVAVASHPQTAPALLRCCLDLARDEGRVCVFVEPIARYHTRDLFDGDAGWLAPYDATSRTALGEVVVSGNGRDLLIVTFGNGVFMSLRVAVALRAEGFGCTVLDLAWVAPLPVEGLLQATQGAAAVLVVDETRTSGGVSEGIVAALADAGVPTPVARLTSADSFVPLGPAADTVLLQEGEILDAAHQLLRP